MEQSQKALLVAVLAMLQYVTIQQNKHITKAIMQIPLCCEWLAARIVKEAADSCKRKPYRLKSQNHANTNPQPCCTAESNEYRIGSFSLLHVGETKCEYLPPPFPGEPCVHHHPFESKNHCCFLIWEVHIQCTVQCSFKFQGFHAASFLPNFLRRGLC